VYMELSAVWTLECSYFLYAFVNLLRF
jgi:hypothetical protein